MAKRGEGTHTSKCSFQNGLRDFFTVLDANFSTPSTDTTTNGSGSRNRFRLGSPLALRTGSGKQRGLGEKTEGWEKDSLVILTLLRTISGLLLEDERSD
jgi:hypothetical protein